MSNYDGPSYYKKNHPKVEPIRAKNDSKKKEKVSWTEKDNHYENEHKKTLPNRITTRENIRDKALDYMQMPANRNNVTKKVSPSSNPDVVKRYQPINEKIDEERKRAAQKRFRKKHIPTSLQRLDGWKKRSTNFEAVSAIRERLAKDEDTYILFATAADQKSVVKKETTEKQKKQATYNKYSKKDLEKADRVREELNAPLSKPGSGLHRSLSKIMAEDKQALQNGRDKLGSLFSENSD